MSRTYKFTIQCPIERFSLKPSFCVWRLDLVWLMSNSAKTTDLSENSLRCNADNIPIMYIMYVNESRVSNSRIEIGIVPEPKI